MLVGGKEMFASHIHDPANGRQAGQLGDVETKPKRNSRSPDNQRGPEDAHCSAALTNGGRRT